MADRYISVYCANRSACDSCDKHIEANDAAFRKHLGGSDYSYRCVPCYEQFRGMTPEQIGFKANQHHPVRPGPQMVYSLIILGNDDYDAEAALMDIITYYNQNKRFPTSLQKGNFGLEVGYMAHMHSITIVSD